MITQIISTKKYLALPSARVFSPVKNFILFTFILAISCANSRLVAQGITHENCGVNSALVVLSRLGVQVQLESIIEKLGVGGDLSNPTNFEALAALFANYGLHCYKLKVTSVSEVMDFSCKSTMVLIQTHKPPWEHFFVFWKRDDGAVNIDDYPYLNVVMGRDAFLNRQEKNFTGNVLIISKSPIEQCETITLNKKLHEDKYDPVSIPGVKQNSSDAFKNDTIKISGTGNILHGYSLELRDVVEMGTISSRSKDAIAWCEIRNVSSKEVAVQKITGGCSCFLGSVPFNRVIKPGSAVRIGLRFDPSRMRVPGPGEVSSSLVLETTDPGLSTINIQVHGRVVNSFAWGFIPEVVDLGAISMSRASNYTAEFALFALTPIDAGNLEVINKDSPNLECELNLFPKNALKKVGSFIQYGTLNVHLLAAPAGRFKFTIQIRNKISGEVEFVEIKGVGCAG